MGRTKNVFVGIAVILMLVAAGLIISYNNPKAKYEIYQDHRELFAAVKDETELLMTSLDNRSDIGNTFIYSNNGNAVGHQFLDGANADLQDKVGQIIAVSEDKLNFLRYSRQDGKSLLRFVFDWEGENGNTYHIVYCDSQDLVEKAYNEEPANYKLDQLADGWYGIEIK
ncbi:hypothetical protein P40081_36925 [Paenibacillus sp. FSL P4-0081]|jgi:hypothetical protein|uniref:hypothetical protein n=1 Tax=Paenibacillus sp. FSL P4-0081 TaxID=1536769 RepID=UPI0004F75A2B|nr:hypothetical protein [Paenibacillus sp. FSL P4-0081]AIQ33072.1 hypothetical protein P40081_36925 [Paenibacillus sp. FSL P4-0081]